MKKKIIPLFLAAAVSVSGVLPIGAVQPVTVMAENGHPARLVDNAGLLDEDEALDVLEYPFEEAYQMAARGEMIDAKTIAALMMAKEQLGEELLP